MDFVIYYEYYLNIKYCMIIFDYMYNKDILIYVGRYKMFS